MEASAQRKLLSLIDPGGGGGGASANERKGQPNIEPHPTALAYEIAAPCAGAAAATGFADLAGLMPDSPFAQDMKWVADMEDVLADGTGQVAMLYTFRSCSRALPVVS